MCSQLQDILLQGASFDEILGEQFVVSTERDCVDTSAWDNLDWQRIATLAGDDL